MTETAKASLWKIRIMAIVWFLLVVGFLLSAAPLIDLSWMILLGIVLLALVVAFPLAWLVRRLSSSARIHSFRRSLVTTWAALTLVLGILVAAPIYFLAFRTEFRPLAVPQATLTDGTKTVVFQGMVHVGSEGFYKSVIYDLEKALTDGYVLYYEGVQDSPEGDAWFSETLAGGGDLSDNYRLLSDICGLNFQLDYFTLLQPDMRARPELHVAADVTTADMMHEYERLMQEDPDFAAAANAKRPAENPAAATGGSAGLTSMLVNWLQNGTDSQRDLAGTICRGVMTMVLSHDSDDPLNQVVLDFRNRKLAERIVTDEHPLIYITYGSGHLPGLLADLQAIDPAWSIQTLKWTRALETPEDVTGQLAGYAPGG